MTTEINDMENVVQMLESREWAEHATKTPLGQRLEACVTALHSDLNDATSGTEFNEGWKRARDYYVMYGDIGLRDSLCAKALREYREQPK